MARAEMLKVKKKKRNMLMRKSGRMRWYLSCRNDSDRGCFRRSLGETHFDLHSGLFYN